MHETIIKKTYYPEKQAAQALVDRLTLDDPEWFYCVTEGRFKGIPMWYVTIYDQDYQYVGTL
jgi:hypothetical protein